MTRKSSTEKIFAETRRHKRYRMALLLIRDGADGETIADMTGLAAASVATIQTVEARRIHDEKLDARPLHLQVMGSGMKGRPSRLPFTVPAETPTNICAACLGRWIFYNAESRKAGCEQRRIIECPHVPGRDGALYQVAFIVRGNPATWLQLSDVEPSRMNELYFELKLRNGEPYRSAVAQGRELGARAAAEVFDAHVARQVQALKVLALGEMHERI